VTDGAPAAQTPSSAPLISCLCVTHDRVHMLRNAVSCFLAQTHPARELVIFHEDGDRATREFVDAMAHPMIRRHEVLAHPHIRLGSKRNLMVKASLGHYVATWDDDDWHAPTRLADQLNVIVQSGARACVLQHVVVHDAHAGRSWLSQRRSWDQTVLAERAIMPPYADLDVGGDFPCVNQLAAQGDLAALASPHLYVYVYHGGNVGSATHFKDNVFARSTLLTEAASQRIAQLLATPQSEPPLTLAEVLAGRAGGGPQPLRP
jgi:glycosyltransferase involved in cell wall biosynthesis